MIITVILGIALTAWSSVEQYVNQFVRYKIDAVINDKLYEQFLGLDFWRYDDKNTVDLFDKAQQFSRFFGYVFDRLTSVIQQVVTMVAGLIGLMFVSWWLGVILILAVIPGMFIQYRLSKAQIAHWASNVETRRMTNMIEWGMFKVSTIAELRMYGMVKHLLSLRRSLREKDVKDRIDFERQYIFKRLMADVVESAAEVTALIFTALQIVARVQPIGQFLYVQQVVSRALSGSRGVISEFNSIDEDVANLFDYNQFMELPQARHRQKNLYKKPKQIIFDDVSFHYPANDTQVLQHISLVIDEGAHIAIVGENGAGKSTFTKLLLGLYSPTDGTVTVDGVNLADVKLADCTRILGFCSKILQHFHLRMRKIMCCLVILPIPMMTNGFMTHFHVLKQKHSLRSYQRALIHTSINGWSIAMEPPVSIFRAGSGSAWR